MVLLADVGDLLDGIERAVDGGAGGAVDEEGLQGKRKIGWNNSPICL